MRHNIAPGTVDLTVGSWSGHPVLSVANTGPVIAPDDVGRLFQPFQRSGADRVASRDGLGLGLSIVGAIAQAHGAWLQATALPGGGLAVQVGFPRAEFSAPLARAVGPRRPAPRFMPRLSGSRRFPPRHGMPGW